MIRAPKRFADYTEDRDEFPQERIEPHVIRRDGREFVMVHSGSLSVGCLFPNGLESGIERAAIIIYGPPSDDGELSVALFITPTPDQLDGVAENLKSVAARLRTVAGATAKAALDKAAGA